MAQVFYFHPLQPYQPKGFIALVPSQRRALPFNLILNGGFDDTSAWALGSGCTISGSKLNATAAGLMCQQPVTYISGHTYQIDFDYTCTSGSKLRINLNVSNGANIVVTSGALTTDGSIQHLTLTYVSNVATDYTTIEADSATFTGTIDSVTAKEVISSAVTHDATGVLTGPGSTIVGAAVYNAVHPTSSVLIGPGSTIVGSAARTREHATTGILTGPGSTVAGVAVYNAKHTTSGVLTGAGSVVVGAAARTREHATTGVLTGPGSTIAGAAIYNAKHTTTATLTGPGSTVAGTAARTGTAVASHATSGALVGQPSIIDGAVRRTRQHAASGILTGPPALIVGVVTRWRDHDSSGALLGVAGVVFGRVFNGTPQLHDIPVDSDNLVNEPSPPSEEIGAISEPSGQIVNHPPYPAA